MNMKKVQTTMLEEVQKKLSDLFGKCQSVCDLSKTAERNGKPLNGHNYYADKFHSAVLGIQQVEADILRLVRHANLNEQFLARFKGALSAIRSALSTPAARTEQLRTLRAECQSELIPHLEGLNASPIPITELVLPMDVVKGTRSYFEKPVIQANGCYEHQWFDACAVMIRKFVESLIIEVYEANNREAEIKDGSNNYFMLRDLIDAMLNDASWNLGRETKQRFPDLKSVGDRSAHNRRYFATKQDIDGIRPALRLIADELLHLAKIK
jgi:hypothetical protein